MRDFYARVDKDPGYNIVHKLFGGPSTPTVVSLPYLDYCGWVRTNHSHLNGDPNMSEEKTFRELVDAANEEAQNTALNELLCFCSDLEKENAELKEKVRLFDQTERRSFAWTPDIEDLPAAPEGGLGITVLIDLEHFRMVLAQCAQMQRQLIYLHERMKRLPIEAQGAAE